MILNGVIQTEAVSISPLTSINIESWSTKPVWYWREAVKLSIGCCPEPTVNDRLLSQEESLEWGTKLGNRMDESERAMKTGELPYIKIPYNLEDENTFPAFRPLDFVSWLRRSNLPHPHELYEAVYRFHSRELGGSEQARHLFHKKLQAWEVRFGDIVLDGVKDLLGMTYIRLLLQYTDQPLDVIEMQGLAGGHSKADGTDEIDSDGDTEDVSVRFNDNLSEYAETSDLVLDDTARRQYGVRLEKLQESLEIAKDARNSAGVTAILQEMEFITGELNGATGLRGRKRRLNPLSEKCRKSITKAIVEAIANIRMLEGITGHQEAIIAEHLKLCIKTGTTCHYDITRNNPPIVWYF